MSDVSEWPVSPSPWPPPSPAPLTQLRSKCEAQSSRFCKIFSCSVSGAEPTLETVVTGAAAPVPGTHPGMGRTPDPARTVPTQPKSQILRWCGDSVVSPGEQWTGVPGSGAGNWLSLDWDQSATRLRTVNTEAALIKILLFLFTRAAESRIILTPHSWHVLILTSNQWSSCQTHHHQLRTRGRRTSGVTQPRRNLQVTTDLGYQVCCVCCVWRMRCCHEIFCKCYKNIINVVAYDVMVTHPCQYCKVSWYADIITW